jgi:hypothetical protein
MTDRNSGPELARTVVMLGKTLLELGCVAGQGFLIARRRGDPPAR